MTLTQINKAGLDEIALDHVFTIGASGSSAYTFQGEGLNGTVNNPTLYLTRGKTYRFENGSGGHPIRIQSTSGASGTAYNTGVTNNAGSGTVIVEVQHDAPDVLYYQCTSHAAMNGILYITGALADGGVTEAKIASSAVTTAKLANDAVTSDKIADSNVTTAAIADSAVTAAKIAANAVTNSELASDAVRRAHILDGEVIESKIADQAVALSKLPHGTSSNDGKFLRANNGADPTFETVTSTTINSNAATRVILGSASANTLNASSNLTFNSNTLDVNGKATFPDGNSNGVVIGDGSDLKLFHNGSHSYVENTEGVLHITNTNDIKIQTGGGANELAIDCNSNGSVDLYYDQSKKLETTSNGIKVIGESGAATSGNIQMVSSGGYKNAIGNIFATNAYDSRIEFGISDGSTSGGTNRVASISYAGISFGTDTAGANRLDDYEEGTWTPRLGGTSNYSSYYVDGYGWYVKIGRIVHWCLRFQNQDLNNSASGGAMIGGFPYNFHRGNANASVSGGFVDGGGAMHKVVFTGTQKHSWYGAHNNTAIYGLVTRSNQSWVDWPVSDFHSSDFYMIMSGTYQST